MPFKKYTKKTSGGRKTTFKKRTYSKPTKAIKKMVKREIARNVENKTREVYFNNVTIYPSNATLFQNNVVTVSPNSSTLSIAQGTTQGARIGNQIKTKKLVMRGIFNPLEFHSTTNVTPRPVNIKMIVFYDRQAPSAVPQPLTNLFQLGSSQAGLVGALSDMIMPYNNDRYRVLATKQFKLGYSNYIGTTGSGSPQETQQYWANNDYKMNCQYSWDLTKYMPQMVKFNDASNDPTTRGLYVLTYIVPADGTVYGTVVEALTHTYVIRYDYEDA